MKCIICNKEIYEKSIEHIFPLSLGGNVKVNSVCKTCNDKLGYKIDCLLTENADFYCLRAIFGIKNRQNKLPDITKKLKFTNSETHTEVWFEYCKGRISGIREKGSSLNLLQGSRASQIYADITYDLDKYKPLCVKILHEFLYLRHTERYESTSLYKNLSEYLYNYIYNDTNNLKDLKILNARLMLNDYCCTKNVLKFFIKKSTSITIGINIFDYLFFIANLNSDFEYQFIDNCLYIN